MIRLTQKEISDLWKKSPGIGSSDLWTLIYGTGEDIVKLWERKVGIRERDNLTDNIRVQLGIVTEDYNRQLFEHYTGHTVVAKNTKFNHPEYTFMRCEVDGLVEVFGTGELAVLECKMIDANKPIQDAAFSYMPQLHHEMACSNTRQSFLSCFVGNNDWRYMNVPFDEYYFEYLLGIEKKFWECIRTFTVPDPIELFAMANPDKKAVVIDATRSGFAELWQEHASSFSMTKDAAILHDKAKDALKRMVPMNADIVHCNTVEARRGKRGVRLSVRKD